MASSSLNSQFLSAHRLFRKTPPPSSTPTRPYSPSPTSIARRIFLIGIGTGPASSLFSPTTTTHPNTWPTFIQMDEAEAATSDGEFPRVVDSAVEARVKRPAKKVKSGEEEVLVIDGIEVGNNDAAKFDVLINVEDWRTCGPRSSEFAGSFVHVPRKPWLAEGKVKTRLVLGITDLLREIRADGDDDVMVTLVPRGDKYVRVGGMRIDSISS